MSKHWIENYDPFKHQNKMWGTGLEINRSKNQKIDPDYVFFVKVCSFTFEFHSMAQVDACLEYYSKKTHPSSIIPYDELGNYGGGQSETQRWFDRLPMELMDNHRRSKVVKALEKAKEEFNKKIANE